MGLYVEKCLACGKVLGIKDVNKVLFCHDECKKEYYNDAIMKVVKELEIDVPFETRWEQLDLRQIE